MKNKNIWRIIWIISLYVLLLIILYLVITYKVKWEHKDLNKYLYFYNCSNEVCTSDQKQLDYYSKVICDDNICPHIKEKNDNILILSRENKDIIYDYIEGVIINDKYKEYKYLNDDLYIVTSSENLQGIININGEVLVDTKYELIKNYKNELIAYCEDSVCGIDSIDETKNVDSIYEDIVLINNSLFSYKKDNNYYLKRYDGAKNINDVTYNYVYSHNDLILVINNNTLDILDTNLKSVLVLKINTYYNYETEKERASLNLFFDDKYLHFTIVSENNEKLEYKFDVKNKKFV